MEGYISEIRLFAGSFVPRGWAACDGSTMDVNSNQTLFSLIGTIYGGDGRTNFLLPKIDNLGETKYIICINGTYPSRN